MSLHVVTAYSNPFRWRSRLANFRAFEREMVAAGVQLHVVDLAHHGMPWEASGSGHSPDVDYVQKRCRSILWHKENMLNEGFKHVPKSARHIAWFDADIHFRDPNFADRIVHMLEIYPVGQPWTDVLDLGPNGEIVAHNKSFSAMYASGVHLVPGPAKYAYPHPGFAWAARRDFLEATGGLIDRAILGSGDYHMAFSLIGEGARTARPDLHPHFHKMIADWQRLALEAGQTNVGCVNMAIEHMFHGSKTQRKYVDRNKILVRDRYDPQADVVLNLDGILEFTRGKHRLKRDVTRYFRSRNEDDNVI